MNRREFLLTGGIASTVVMVGIPGLPEAQTPAVMATYPRKLIAKLSDLNVDELLDFEYPDEGLHSESILVKLEKRPVAGWGRKRTSWPSTTRAPTRAGRCRALFRPPTRRWSRARCT